MRQMLAKLVFIFALIGSSFAQLDLNRELSIDLNGVEAHSDRAPISHAGAVVVNGVSQANNMTMSCNNKFCEMLKYLATCKSINLGMKKICAVHLLGYKYGCDVFPPASDVVSAPSICIPSALKILAPIKNDTALALAAILGPYLNTTNFESDNCGRHCFQNFQYATHDFYSTCRPQLSALVPFASLMSAFQEYRNQACSLNPNGQNCYVSVMGLVSPPTTTAATSTAPDSNAEDEDEDLAPEDELAKILREGQKVDLSGALTMVDALESINAAVEASIAAIPAYVEGEVRASAVTEEVAQVEAVAAAEVADVVTEADSHRFLQQAPANLFDFTCAYTPYPAPNVLAGVCAKLSPLGCCAATGLTMIQQNPISSIGALAAGGAADPIIFPPCLYRYLEDACPAVDLTNYCTNGSIASNTVIRGTIFSPIPPPSLQNVYTKAGTLTLQGIIMNALVGTNPALANWPYLFSSPLQIQIVDYTYYSDSAGTVPLTPSNGQGYTPQGGDYTAALSGNFTYQIVNQDLDTTTAATLTAVLRSPTFQALMSKIMTGFPTVAGDPTKVKTKTSMNPEIFAPTPLVFHNSASSLTAHRGLQGLLTVLLTLGASLLLMKPFGSFA